MPAPRRTITSNVFVNVSDIPPGELPSVQPTEVSGELLMWPFDGVTLWLRPDQINEIIAKLAVHLPEAPVRRVLRDMLTRQRYAEQTLGSVARPSAMDPDADLPTPKEVA